jgi:hypothetical protein
MSANKYNKITVNIDGEEVERHKVVFTPNLNKLGGFCTLDGKKYRKDSNGQIRRIRDYRSFPAITRQTVDMMIRCGFNFPGKVTGQGRGI